MTLSMLYIKSFLYIILKNSFKSNKENLDLNLIYKLFKTWLLLYFTTEKIIDIYLIFNKEESKMY